MDMSQLTASSTLASSGAQGAQGHHHHHRKSVSDQVSDMSSAIDQAVKAGSLSSDQAASMKNELADISKTLSQSQSNSTSQTGATSQLSAQDRKKVMSELHDVGKQLYQAMNPQSTGTTAAQSSNQLDSLFSAIDANSDGKIDKGEMADYINKLADSSQGAQDLFIGSMYNPQGGLNPVSSSANGSSLNLWA